MKNNTTRFSISALVLAIGLTQMSFVYADNCNKPEYQVLLKIKNIDVLHRIDELNLTKDQSEQFKTIKNNLDTERTNAIKSLKSIDKQMQLLAASSTIDQARLDNLMIELKKNVTIVQTQNAISRHNLYNLLNDKQKAKYHELQQQERAFFQMSLQCPKIAMKANHGANLVPFNHIDELNLAKEQKEKILPLIQANQDQSNKLLQQLDDSDMSYNQEEAKIIQSTSPIDSTKLNEFTAAQNDAVVELHKIRLITIHEIFNLLTPEQQNQFIRLIKKQLD